MTFTWNVREETAYKKLRQFINELERSTRANACFIARQEARPLGHGMNVPIHFHLLLASNADISAEAIKALWLKQVTSRSTREINTEGVRTERFKANAGGIEYCLKSLNDDHGDWLIFGLVVEAQEVVAIQG